MADPLEDAEETIWLRRLHDAHAQAVTDQDVRGQQAVANSALRAIRARKAEKEKAAKAAIVAESDDNKVSIGDLDSLVEVFSDPSTVPDPVDRAKVEFVMRKAHGLMRMDAEQLFQRMWSSPRFCNALIDFASQWKEPEEHEPVQEKITVPN